MSKFKKYKIYELNVFFLMSLIVLATNKPAVAQGQDTSRSERDQQVIAALLPGEYFNANQSYFDKRTATSPAQNAYKLAIRAEGNNRHPKSFKISVGKKGEKPKELVAVLSEAKNSDVTKLALLSENKSETPCTLYFSRQAGQFGTVSNKDCNKNPSMPKSIELSERHLWWHTASDGLIKFDKSRKFTCHADIPGVGGGRNEPYKRFSDLKIHDQGGQEWIKTDTGRNLAIRLFRVDWPINNFDGEFARDSLAMYVIEKNRDGSFKEHGYAFVDDEADRIGLNLKWILVSCYLQSNKVTTPEM